jgi:hypothetical protein
VSHFHWLHANVGETEAKYRIFPYRVGLANHALQSRHVMVIHLEQMAVKVGVYLNYSL